ncbi:MAG: MerR family transcriptional regulator [Nitrososphaeria archaeon]
MDRLYTLKDAKRLLGVTTWIIQRWDKRGKIRRIDGSRSRRREVTASC